MTTKSNQSADLNWIEIDPATLPQSAQKLWTEYKAAYQAATAKRTAFEALMQDLAVKNETCDGQTTELRFGYRFGKLALAVAAKVAKSTASKKAVAFGKLAA